MTALTVRLPDEKHRRLKALAKSRGTPLNRLIDEMTTLMLTEFDAETRFQIVGGSGQRPKSPKSASNGAAPYALTPPPPPGRPPAVPARANYQLFIADLCALLELPKPDPAQDDTRDNAYVFERRVIFKHGDGGSSNGFIDCYRRGSAIIEAKKIKLGAQTKGFDDAMLRARSQAENYARALPAEEGRPPFLITIDVGHRIELFAEFTRSGATYTPFPDPRSHRIGLEDLRDEKIRARLKAIWLDPLSLDPSRASAKATREIASKLAGIAKTLENAGHDAERVAGFLTRCLFSMFAEDVGLLPKASFSELLESLQGTPGQFVPLVGALWKEMDEGGFSVVLRQILPRFNGKLFKTPDVLPLDRDQIGLLREAARADWTLVEPAIFGTLLERALDPAERHSLGAHYTPRPYVERLVLPTVIEPLRQRWANVQAAALLLANESKSTAALAEIDAFHHQLCQIRVLDPACGSANFLYVTLEHMKRLEGEILDFAQTIGQRSAADSNAWKLKASPSTRTSFSASNSTRAPPPSPNSCCGSVICNGISAPAAPACRPAPSCATSKISNAATPCSTTTAAKSSATNTAYRSAVGTAKP
ncbi:MAG: class I SAM-dependent DNA methyltransferase [Betaproteobacteria bacterium]|nr:class I SAM-dependent DNA methyltransferase [Betaproteobacteria bacterium]